jgi:hypothetical protein
MKYCKYRAMRRNNLVFKQTEQESLCEEDSSICGIPICGANLSTPVLNQIRYVDEIHYKIGERLYIENAD